MNKVVLKKLGFGILYTLLALYIIFLVSPFLINPFLAKYTEQISSLARESCGLNITIEKLKIVTTPKLTAGIKIDHLSAALPDGEEFLSVDNTQAKLSLIPLIVRKIEVDMFSIDNIQATLKVKPDGNLQIIDYLPEAKDDDNKEQLTALPMGLRLSNRLPNVYIKEYMLTMVDMRDNREYTVQGGNLKVTDFVLDKKVKFSTVGIAKFDGEQQFAYNLKVFNKIMPDIDLNDLIFAQNSQTDVNIEKKTEDIPIAFNIIDVFKSIKTNGLTADAVLNIETTGKLKDIHIKGLMDIENLSILVNGVRLPEGHIKFAFKGQNTSTDIALYTAKDEVTTIIGELGHGKNAKIDLAVKSKAGINNIFNVLKSIASSFNCNDIDTLSASGSIDADFNIKSNMKTVSSDGYFKIPQASIKYALYNILIDNINADIDFSENQVNIKNIGLSILSQPLKIYGTISNQADADVHIKADKLLLKGLLAAAGQVGLLKENDIKSGTLSVDALLSGNLKTIIPSVDVSVDNLNLLNKPSSTSLKLAEAKLNISSDGKKYKGDADVNAINIINPAIQIAVPQVNIMMDEKDVNIADTYLVIDNSRFDIKGKIADYTTKNMAININAKGSVLASDILRMVPSEMRSMFSTKGALPVLVVVSGNDKKQTVDFQLLTTPSGYFRISDLQSISGKSMLVNSKINISGNSLTLDNTGAFVSNLTSLSDNPASNFGGNPIIKVSGGISDLTNLNLKNLNIATVGTQTISVPLFSGSQAGVSADVTLNGNMMAPLMKGAVKSSAITLPTIKTTIKNLSVDLGNTININAPDIAVSDSKMSIHAVVSPNFTNGLIIKSVDFNSLFINADTLGQAAAGVPSGGSTSSSNATSDLGVVIQSGKANITKFQTGKIIAENLTSDFNLKNNIFTLKNLTGTAFKGTINGNISVNAIKGNTNVEMTGTGMDAVSAIEAGAGIPNALSGTLGFNAKLALNAFASDFNAMMKSIKGTVSFDVKDGTYLNIGTIDRLVLANNILSNAILKAAVIKIKSLPVVANSSKFSDITGSISLNNGIALLAPVKSSGTSIAYYVTGQYNLLNGYTNVTILGRMGADLVAALGPLGDLSVSKLSSYLPSFGANTLTLLNNLTSNPATENVAQIPALTGGSDNYKDFKVLFNGNVTSASSIKSFKWLSTCDTSAVTTGTVVDQIKTDVKNTKENIKNNVQNAKQSVEDAKAAAQAAAEDAKTQFNNAKNAVNELKNLKNIFKTSTPASTPAVAE